MPKRNVMQNSSEKGGNVTRSILALILSVFALLLTVGCDAGPTAKGSGLDASAKLACRDYLKLLEDMQAGILNESEIRERMKDIYETARSSDSVALRSASQRMLKEITYGTSLDGMKTALGDMTSACTGK